MSCRFPQSGQHSGLSNEAYCRRHAAPFPVSIHSASFVCSYPISSSFLQVEPLSLSVFLCISLISVEIRIAWSCCLVWTHRPGSKVSSVSVTVNLSFVVSGYRYGSKERTVNLHHLYPSWHWPPALSDEKCRILCLFAWHVDPTNYQS